jgi:hypothetical protein
MVVSNDRETHSIARHRTMWTILLTPPTSAWKMMILTPSAADEKGTNTCA